MKNEPKAQHSCRSDQAKRDRSHSDGVWLNRQDIHDLRNEVQAIRLGIGLVMQSDSDEKSREETKVLLEASLCRMQQIIDSTKED